VGFTRSWASFEEVERMRALADLGKEWVGVNSIKACDKLEQANSRNLTSDTRCLDESCSTSTLLAPSMIYILY
jgi:hypothetical protein